MVERFHDYLETLVPAWPPFSLPGRLQRPTQRVLGAGQRPASSGVGLPPGRAGRRRSGGDAGRCRRCRRSTGWQQTLRLPRDHYVRLDCNDYSVHPAAVGRRVEVRADLDRVRVACDGLAGRRPPAGAGLGTKRSPTPSISLAARQLRRCRGRSARPRSEVESAALADYDIALRPATRAGGVMASGEDPSRRDVTAEMAS